MIEEYYIEDLTLDKLDKLVERGDIFIVSSKTALLPQSVSDPERDAFWGNRDKQS